MQDASAISADPKDLVAPEPVPAARQRLGQLVLIAGWAVLLGTLAVQVLSSAGLIYKGFDNWRPLVYAYLAWAVAFGWSQVLRRGNEGSKALFVLPAVLFIAAMVIFPREENTE